MRLSEFWRRMNIRFGERYARTLAGEYTLTDVAGTIDEALERGVPPKEVWRAVCAEFDVPAALR